MAGATKFNNCGFTLTAVSKGKNAWKDFAEKLQNPEFDKCNDFTKKYAKDRDEKGRNAQNIPNIESNEYDQLPPETLSKDMEQRYKDGEIDNYD